MSETQPQPSEQELTRFLLDIGHPERTGDSDLMRHVYDHLHALAAGYMRKQDAGHSLQPTGLVHEAYLKLFDRKPIEWNDRMHFFALAARVMRQILVDHARRRHAKGGGRSTCILDALSPRDVGDAGDVVDLIDLDDALNELAEQDERESRVVELRYFGGLTIAETAKVLEVSTPTVERDWAMARAWLAKRLGQGERTS
jgi:RNA polymerase sigma-70 factor (ECF subfamily)